MKSDSGRRLRAGGKWVVIGRGWGVATTIVVSVVLARQMTPADFGAFGVLMSIVTTSSVVAMFGMNMGVVRFLAESLATSDYARAKQILKVVWTILWIGTLSVSLTVGTSLWFGFPKVGESHNSALVCLLAGIAIVLLACNNMMAATLRGFDEARLAIILGPQHSGGPLGLSLFLVLWLTIGALLSHHLESAFALFVVAYAMGLPIGVWWLVTMIRRRFDSMPHESRQERVDFTPGSALRVCLPLMLTQVLSVAVRDSDLWIAGTYGAADELALFVAARRVVQAIAFPLVLINLSVITLIPTLKSQGRMQELQSVLQTAATAAGGISAVCLIVILCSPRLVLQLLFGEYYSGAAVMLIILCLGQFVLTWTGACEMVLMMSGNERWALAVNAVSTLVIIAAGPFVTVRWGIAGLAILSSSVVAVQNIVQWLLVYRLLHVWTHAAPLAFCLRRRSL